MPDFEQNGFGFQVSRDIESCLREKRIDVQMNLFTHIYYMLDPTTQNDPELRKFFLELKKQYADLKFRQQLEFYYAMTVDGEEGRLLFDPSVNYNPKYQMANFLTLYNQISELKQGIAMHLGIVKRKVLQTQSMSMDF